MKRVALVALGIAATALGTACGAFATQRFQKSFNYALNAETAGDWEEAARHAAEAQAALPPGERVSDRALITLGERARIELQRGRDDEAERLFGELHDRIEGEWPGSPSLGYSLNQLATLRARRGDDAGARALWTRVTELERAGQRAPEEERAFAYAGLARQARASGDAAGADVLFRKAITQGSTTREAFWEIRREYGALLREIGRAEDASRVEAAIGDSLRSRHYLWHVAAGHSGIDPLDERVVVRWADDRMPLRVYVPPAPAGSFPGVAPDAVREAVIAGVEEWKDVARPGVPSFVFVDSRRDADIRFRWADGMRDKRFAETSPPRTKTFRVMSIWIATSWSPRVAATLAGVRTIVTHETGHALGLWGHSPLRGDLMYFAYAEHGRAVQSELTDRDRETLRLLYGLAPGEIVSRTGLP
jgi:predicted Zn-dependent protease